MSKRLTKLKDRGDKLSKAIQTGGAPRPLTGDEGRMLYVLRPNQPPGAAKVDVDEVDVINVLTALNDALMVDAKTPGATGFVIAQVLTDKAGFIIKMETEEQAALIKGKTVLLAKQKRVLEPYRGGGARNFILTKTGPCTIDQLVNTLTGIYGERSFAMYKRGYNDTEIEGYWLQFQAPVVLHANVTVNTGTKDKGKGKEKETDNDKWLARLMVASTDPCAICRKGHAESICPHVLPRPVRHPKLRPPNE